MTRRWFAIGALALFAMSASCTKSKSTTAAAGSAKRVVSLTPSTTEAMFAIGAGQQMVGRSSFCDYPKEATKLPVVGGYVNPNFEAILGANPDLVIGARGPAGSAVTEKLESRGVATFFPKTESVAEILEMIEGLGARTGHEDQSKALTAKMREKLAAIDRALEGKTRPRVLLVFGVEPVVVAGPGSFPDEMLQRAGAKNAVESGGAYPTLGMERIVMLDPDVVLTATVAMNTNEGRIHADTPGWSRVRAVREGRARTLEDESAIRPGPRVADGIIAMARALHPDVALP